MSFTPSPISSGPTKAGTHNSSTAQRSWRRCLYLLIIRSWRVDEMEFQCCLARFVISNTGVMRSLTAANLNGGKKGNMIHLDEKWEEQPGEKRSARWGVLCGKEQYHERCWRSVKWKRRPSSQSWGGLELKGLRGAEWNWGEPKESGLRSVESNWEAPTDGGLSSSERNPGEPIQTEEHRWNWGVVIPEEERRTRVGKECVMHDRSAGGKWRAPILGWGAWNRARV